MGVGARGDPLTNAGEAWRYAAMIVPSIAFAVIGVFAFNRRDVRAA